MAGTYRKFITNMPEIRSKFPDFPAEGQESPSRTPTLFRTLRRLAAPAILAAAMTAGAWLPSQTPTFTGAISAQDIAPTTRSSSAFVRANWLEDLIDLIDDLIDILDGVDEEDSNDTDDPETKP